MSFTIIQFEMWKVELFFPEIKFPPAKYKFSQADFYVYVLYV